MIQTDESSQVNQPCRDSLFAQSICSEKVLSHLEKGTLFRLGKKVVQQARQTSSSHLQYEEWMNSMSYQEERVQYSPKKLRQDCYQPMKENIFQTTILKRKKLKMLLRLPKKYQQKQKQYSPSKQSVKLDRASECFSVHKDACFKKKLSALKNNPQKTEMQKQANLTLFQKVWPNLCYRSMKSSVHELSKLRQRNINPLEPIKDKTNFGETKIMMKKAQKEQKKLSTRKSCEAVTGNYIPHFLMSTIHY